jgi:glycine cleavage system regulatory protein
LLSDLVDGPAREIVTPEGWAKRTVGHLDTNAFLDASGLGDDDVEQIIGSAARHALDLLRPELRSAAGTRILRFRDRWVRLVPFEAADVIALTVEPLRPLLAIVPRGAAHIVVPFAQTDVYDASDHVRLQFADSDAWEASVKLELPSGNVDARPRVTDGALELCLGAARLLADQDSALETVELSDSTLVALNLDRTRPRMPSADEKWYVASYLARDKPGVLAAVTSLLAEQQINIVAATEATIAANAMLSFLVTLPQVLDEMEVDQKLRLPKERIELVRTRPDTTRHREVPTPHDGSLWNISLRGPDRRGQLLMAVKAIAKAGGFVRRCTSTTTTGEDGPQFNTLLMVQLRHDANIDALRRSLTALLQANHPSEDYEIRVASAPSVLDYWFDAPSASTQIEGAEVLVVTGVADDGLASLVCQAIYDLNLNIVGAAMAVLGDWWIASFAVSGPDAKQAKQDIEERLLNLEVDLRQLESSGSMFDAVERYDLRFDALDRRGVLAEPLCTFAERNWNVESVYAHVEQRVHPPVGFMRMTIAVAPTTGHEEVVTAINELATKKGWLSYTVERQDHVDRRSGPFPCTP